MKFRPGDKVTWGGKTWEVWSPHRKPGYYWLVNDEQRRIEAKASNMALASRPTLATALVERDTTMQQVEDNADDQWVMLARKAVEQLADGHPFTTDDVWFFLTEQQVAPPREPRALGPVMFRAIKDGVIEKTGEYLLSVRRHGSPLPVYRKVQTLKGY